jgi:hypothetical protein
MKASAEQFDTLIAAAEKAAASFDGRGVERAMSELAAFMNRVQIEAVDDGPLLQHMHDRLARYQKLCQFLQDTLHRVLVGAVNQGEPACYGHHSGGSHPTSPHGAHQLHTAPLIRRYC